MLPPAYVLVCPPTPTATDMNVTTDNISCLPGLLPPASLTLPLTLPHTDMNVITDDDLRVLVTPLASKPGVKFTMIADCCHRYVGPQC